MLKHLTPLLPFFVAFCMILHRLDLLGVFGGTGGKTCTGGGKEAHTQRLGCQNLETPTWLGRISLLQHLRRKRRHPV